MPKIVDHEMRRRELADAAWRVIRRDGLEAASVRNIAKEAGVSLGSLRHYFNSQDELLAYALGRVIERVRERIGNLRLTGDIRRDIVTIIEQTLPLDEERQTEAIIWLAYLGKMLTNAGLGALAAKTHDELYHLFRRLLDAMKRHGLLDANADPELEARRMHALIDGLAVHGVVSRHAVDHDTIRAVVTRHLESLSADRPSRT
ncbi:MAG: TetR family transcriptional regulator [Thermobacillus sp. ZCTH02-B1]|uniref:TetR/AcrR family transcriptional regulator n=1 Tax=Thermobacillus sp. ZCTH02-B1 TaxID=1858795 RepID=UPI000B573E3B|nr:TetR/AcrR family transcriptional regulator [Thermobacillus sp. ZCTH02-B1]OUM95187.1 MAG: TetR family transcriptional regulator [Thermobacillus sp. ZCTH02-B1]